MNGGLQALVDFCARKHPLSTEGVETFFSVRWMLVAALYLLSAAVMALDPWYGREIFTYAQGGYVILLAVVLVATLAFDWCYLGRSRGGNLFLQILLLLPMTLLLGRLIGSPSERLVADGGTLLQHAKELFSSAAQFIGLADLIPNPVKELFVSPKSAFLFAAVCFSLTAPRNKMLRVGLMVTVLAFLIAFTLADTRLVPAWQFIVGMVLLFAGLSLQFHDVTQEALDRNIKLALRTVDDEAERRSSIRVLKRVCAEGRLSPRTAYEIISRCYVERFHVDAARVRSEIAPVILNRLVSEHGLLDLVFTRGETEVRPSAALMRTNNPWLAVAVVPRCVVVGAIALVWWLTPIDLIPDALPIVGAMDDFVILSLGGGGVIQSIRALRAKRAGELPGPEAAS